MKKSIELEACEYYLKLGPKRTYRQVANHFGENLQNISKWGSKGKWVKQSQEYDSEVHTVTVEQLKKDDIDIKTRLYIAMDRTIEKYLENLDKGDITLENVRDLELIGKMWKELEAPILPENSQNNNNQQSTNQQTGINVHFDINGRPKLEGGTVD